MHIADIAREADLVSSTPTDFWSHVDRQCDKDDGNKKRCASEIHWPSGVLKLDLLQCMNKFVGGVGSSHNWEGFRVPKCFLQMFRSTGHMCNLGTSSVESNELG